jgi:valyl-tRNA synthetase
VTTTAGLQARYSPQDAEPRWAKRWKEHPFRAEPGSDREPFTIVIPPPNVTGNLHLGHALDNAIQDSLVRYHRMRGREALWLPGTDHAGIATQVVVEKMLREEGTSRHEIGREKFLERVWEWKERYGGEILHQLHRLGASCDWTRERFTMDEGLSRAVRRHFVNYVHEGLAYRADRITNWCPEDQTTLSDLEVDREEQDTFLWTIAYPAADGGEPVKIATQRPETIFADVAIAVNPEDPRHSGLVGRRVRIPLSGKEIPVIADETVDPEFGTGALKITPAHDPADYEVGERHGLPRPSVIDLNARLHGDLVPEQFRGMDRFEARKAVVKALAEAGHLQGEERYRTAFPICDRCRTVIEPVLLPQWWVRMRPLADRVLDALARGEIRIVPERWKRVQIAWLEEIRDWNISRQLWWGHQVPAWYTLDGEVVVPSPDHPDLDPPDDPRFAGVELTRDPDVFDTWFSSALWPFSTLGWPDDTADLRRFYPTQVLVTGYEIRNLWVARMMMTGYHFMGERPFEQVLYHGMVLDKLGRKMSKSLNNGIDPLDVVASHGADALRFGLAYLATGGQDIKLDPRWLDLGRNFVTKTYQAGRLVELSTSPQDRSAPAGGVSWLSDRWIRSRLEALREAVDQGMADLEPAAVARSLYETTWSDYCDWYLEAIKVRPESADTRRNLAWTFHRLLALLHPLVPFVTCELAESLYGVADLSLGEWPEPRPFDRDPSAEASFDELRAAITALRALRAEAGLAPSARPRLVVSGPAGERMLAERELAEFLARAELVGGEGPPRSLVAIAPGFEGYLELAADFDLAGWRTRQEKEAARLEKQLLSGSGRLANDAFLEKAPPEVVEELRIEVARNRDALQRIRSNLERLA